MKRTSGKNKIVIGRGILCFFAIMCLVFSAISVRGDMDERGDKGRIYTSSTTKKPFANQNDTASYGVGGTVGDTEKNINAGGKSRLYKLFVPSNYVSTSPMPLLIYIHSAGGDEHEEWMIWQQCGYTSQFLIASPRGDFMQSWNEVYNWNPTNNMCSDTVLMMAIYNETIATYNIDLSRVWMMGISDGAKMSIRASLFMSDRLSCDSPCESAWNNQFAPPSIAIRKIPYYEIIGDLDGFLPYAKNAETAFKAAGFEYILDIRAGMSHGDWDPSLTDDVYNWETKKILPHNWIRPALSFNCPASGDKWTAGTLHNVEWWLGCGNAPYQVKLELSTNGPPGPFSTIDTITQNVYGLKQYPWTIPTTTPATTNAVLRATITDSSSPQKTNISQMNYVFEITPYVAPEGSILVSIAGFGAVIAVVYLVKRKKDD